MDLIRELAFLILLNPPRSLDDHIPEGSKMRMLFDAVEKQQVLNDEEAAQLVYDCNRQDKRYLMLKRNLIKKLTELVLIADHTDVNKNNFVSIKFELEKNLTIARKLLLQNVYHNADKMAKKAYKSAQKFHLLDIQLDALKTLRSIYSLKGFPKETGEYLEQVRTVREELILEERLLGSLELLKSKIKFSVASSYQMAKEVLNELKEITNDAQLSALPFAKLYCLQIQSICAAQQLRWDDMYDILQQIENHLEKFPHLITETLQTDLKVVYIRYFKATGQFTSAADQIEKALDITRYKAFNKFEIQFENLDVALKTGNIDLATALLKEVKNVPQFDQLDTKDTGGWFIQEAYLYWLLCLNQREDLLQSLYGSSDYKLSLTVLQEQTKDAVKDKLGFNIRFIIVKSLLQHVFGEQDFEYEGNSLRMYYTRYLKNEYFKRTSFFVKQFYKVLQSDFDSDIIQQAKEEFNKNIESQPCYDPVELIPYEVILEHLQA
jgi:hypothetical protein